MNVKDLQPLEEGIPTYDVLRTTPPEDDIEYAPLWMYVALAIFDLVLWGIIIGAGYAVLTFVAGWM